MVTRVDRGSQTPSTCPAGGGGPAPGWQNHPTGPEATDNGHVCQDGSTSTRTQTGNLVSCPEDGELAPDETLTSDPVPGRR